MYYYNKMTGGIIARSTDYTNDKPNYYNYDQNLIITTYPYTGGLGNSSLTKVPSIGDNINDLVENCTSFNESDRRVLRSLIYQDGNVKSSYSIVITGNGNWYCTMPVSTSNGYNLYYMTVDQNFNISRIINTDSYDTLHSSGYDLIIGHDCYYVYSSSRYALYKVDAETLEISSGIEITVPSISMSTAKYQII